MHWLFSLTEFLCCLGELVYILQASEGGSTNAVGLIGMRWAESNVHEGSSL
jgi:hypothetical protein